MSEIKDYLLVEKYAPTTVGECILPERIKKPVLDFVSEKNIPHMIFTGRAGVGKTSLAKSLCNDIGADMLYVNASIETGIDTVRNKLSQFASVSSFEGNPKVILLDEGDRMSPAAADSLKALIEQFQKSTRFIITSNNIHRIIEPIISRCTVFDFNQTTEETKLLQVETMKRVVSILKKEQIGFDPKSVASLVQKHYPDMRKVLGEIQRYSSNGTIDAGILVAENTSIDELMASIKSKKFGDMRKWIARNSDIDHSTIYRHIYDNLVTLFQPESIPTVVLILAQYQHYAASVVDQEINTVACMVELINEAKWK